ncbi:hypothetical protein HZH68_007846 [Vespula germanica]|uniref:Uncharacterized protein n=1 Tax=Vespula germanica TaxID=30212 RepID=A0A834K6J6_VESGE|nr:hypothetical protein HZH68_007846 [Vespula germanica]
MQFLKRRRSSKTRNSSQSKLQNARPECNYTQWNNDVEDNKRERRGGRGGGIGGMRKRASEIGHRLDGGVEEGKRERERERGMGMSMSMGMGMGIGMGTGTGSGSGSDGIGYGRVRGEEGGIVVGGVSG